MKHLKTKLMMSVVSLMLATIMMTSASFAWFTISTAPEITGMKASVAANGNLEIAIDNDYANEAAVDTASKVTGTDAQGSTSGNWATWGNLADLNTLFGDEGELVYLRPAAFNGDGSGLQTAEYGYDGRVKSLENLSAQTPNSNLKGVKLYTLTDAAPSADNQAYAYSIDFWIRTNTAGNVTLGKAAYRATNGNVDALGTEVPAAVGSYMADTKGLVTYKLVVHGATTDTAFYLAPDTTAAPVINATGDAPDYYGIKVYSDQTCETPVSNDVLFTFADADTIPAQKATLWVYIDGASMTNADALLADAASNFSMQFVHSATLTAMKTTGTTVGTNTYTWGGGTT